MGASRMIREVPKGGMEAPKKQSLETSEEPVFRLI